LEKGKVADTKPFIVEKLEKGTYYWCACGKSTSQPYCDGSHQGSAFSPTELTIEKDQKVVYCLCKQSSNPPFCDGSHSRI
jgi:CDGSH iron-sulfur domain-containing protein 3